MVVIKMNALKDAYTRITFKAIKNEGTVMIYCCYDLDSICSAKIMTVGGFDPENDERRRSEVQDCACDWLHGSGEAVRRPGECGERRQS
jgi:hypothetical protein